MKKSSKSKFGFSMWNKRFCVLRKGRLFMFKSERDFEVYDNPKLQSKEDTSVQPSKIIDMSHVTQVCFHYDKDAP